MERIVDGFCGPKPWISAQTVRRSLAGNKTSNCFAAGKVPLMSTTSLHDLRLFIFFLAVVHVVYSASVMALGRLKIRSWKEWEKETMSPNYEFLTDPSLSLAGVDDRGTNTDQF